MKNKGLGWGYMFGSWWHIHMGWKPMRLVEGPSGMSVKKTRGLMPEPWGSPTLRAQTMRRGQLGEWERSPAEQEECERGGSRNQRDKEVHHPECSWWPGWGPVIHATALTSLESSVVVKEANHRSHVLFNSICIKCPGYTNPQRQKVD